MLTYFSTVIESRRKAETVLNTLIGLRLAIVLISLVTFWQRGPIAGSSLPLYTLLIISCVLSAFYAGLAKLKFDLNDINVVQIIMDVVLISDLVYLTGGNDSNFVFLYMVTVVGAALFLSSRAAWLVASLSVIAISIIAVLYKTDHFPEYTSVEIREQYQQWDQFWKVFVTTHLTHSFGILIIAGLAAALAQRVFQTRLLQEEILENMNEGVLLVEPKGGVMYRNAVVDRLLRRPEPPPSRGRAGAATIDGLFHPQDAERLRRSLDQPERADFILVDSSAPDHTIEAGVIPLSSAGTGGIILTLRDVSLERMLEDNARERQRLEAMREIGAMMAHEVRNPLATVRGFAQEIMRKTKSQDSLRTHAHAILDQSDRIDNLIETFLKFSRMPAPEPFLCDLGELTNRIIAGLEVRPEAAGVEFDLEMEPATGPKQARVDPGQIEQVLMNLGINALQAMDGNVAPRRLLFRLEETQSDEVDRPPRGETAGDGPEPDTAQQFPASGAAGSTAPATTAASATATTAA
ncbi:MAG: histidine kinase dimerization/phospho-acceptor domain-containing protein, partial [Planctomycetota bacterium]